MIPVFKPQNTEATEQAVLEVLRSGWWGLGPKTAEFENRFSAEIAGSRFGVGVNSATAGLDLAVKALMSDKKYLFTTALTFISTALAGLYNDKEVIFLDIDPDTLNLDWNDLGRYEDKLQDGFILPVHYGGRNSYYNTRGEMIGLPELPAIQDCAHAAGTRGLLPGTKVWSFHAVKNLPMGDGGMITTDDESVYEELKRLRWCGINKSTWDRTGEKRYGWDYDIQEIGQKCHMNDLSASIGLAQLDNLEQANNQRKLLVMNYLKELADVPWLKLPSWDPQSAWHMFVIQMDPSLDRNGFIDYMAKNGVSIGMHYKPLNQYPMFSRQVLPVTDEVWKHIATLPLFPDLGETDQAKIIELIHNYQKEL